MVTREGRRVLRLLGADWENYLTTLFFPAHARPSAWAIRAFNVETATVRDAVKDVNIGRIRLQWWRDTIQSTFKGRPPPHPVPTLISSALNNANPNAFPLSQSFFLKLLTARSHNIVDPHYPTVASLESYAEETASSVLYLLAEALGVRDHNADHAMSHLGKAVGIATVIRGTVGNVRERRCYLPSQVLAKHSVSTEDIFRSGPSPALQDAIFEIATTANDHLITARSFAKDVPKRVVPALLSAIPTETYLQELERCNFDIFDKRLHKRGWKVPWRVWNAARKGVW
ncbi:NADH dehydrogenase (ubiquinone) complex I, assembly factor 6 [Rhizophlyctis rosea]|nr:NADH dehydrogenase (ubiquinone) complex I, assembly factor 6 [Rhizophlyctis rosea]